MAESRLLPDLKSRLTIDDADLARVQKNATQATTRLDADFATAGKSTQKLTVGLAEVDKTLGAASKQAATAAASLERLNQVEAQASGTAKGAATSTAENVAVQKEAAAVYGKSAAAAEAVNVSLKGTSLEAKTASGALTQTDAALTATATNAAGTAAAMDALNASMATSTGITGAQAAATQASATSSGAAATAFNNASNATQTLAAVDVKGTAAKAAHTAATRGLGEQLSVTAGKFGVAGEGAEVMGKKLGGVEKMIGAGGSLPIGMTGVIAGLGALYLGFNLLKGGLEDYIHLTEAVDRYSHLTGQSVDASSRQLQAFERLGVSEETSVKIMTKFGQLLEKHPADLEKLGVAIAHTAQGGVDLDKTFINVLDVWEKTGNAVERDTLIIKAFGKTGLDLLPVLLAGSKGLAELEAAARVTITEADIERAKKLKLAQLDLNDAWKTMKENIARNAVPALVDLMHGFNENQYVLKRLNEQGDSWLGARIRMGNANDQVVASLKREFAASTEASHKQNELTQSFKEAADKAAKLEAEVNALAGAELNMADATDAAAHNQTAFDKATTATTQAQVDLTKAIRDYGPKSQQATDAATVLSDAYISETDSAKALAKSQVDVAAKTAEVSGQTLSQKEKLDLLIANLAAQAKALAPGSPVRVGLEAYIALLKTTPQNVTTDISYRIHGAPGDPHQARAGGGPVVPGRIYTVGESGPETLMMGAQGGMVIPGAGRGGAAGGMTQVERLLAETNALLRAIGAPPSGQTGTEAALYKAVQGAGLNRMRGMASAAVP